MGLLNRGVPLYEHSKPEKSMRWLDTAKKSSDDQHNISMIQNVDTPN